MYAEKSGVMHRESSQDAGDGLTEFAVILGLIAVITVLALVFLGDAIAELVSLISEQAEP